MVDRLPPGWVRRPGARLLEQFWLDGYEPVPDQDHPPQAARRGTDGRYRLSPLDAMPADLGGTVQWVDGDGQRALLLRADGLRETGGQWRVFACDGPGRVPRELTTDGQFRYPAEDLHTWGTTERLARSWALQQIT